MKTDEITDDEMRVKIAELCGWRKELYVDTFEGGSARMRWKNPVGEWVGYTHRPAESNWLPDYLNDLNAMHEAEKTLTDEEWRLYADRLWRHAGGPQLGCVSCYTREYVSAKARQRAIAFLKTNLA